jgi:8-amino-7-oxononanoate synthase
MRAADGLHRRVAAHLAELANSGLTRSLKVPAGIDLSSNDYLGLSTHPHIVERMAQAVRTHGCGSTGSRLLRGHRECFTAVERRFAGFKHTEQALYFSSGYLASLAVLTTFPEPGDTVFSDERNHASLIDGIRLSPARRVIFPHNDAPALKRLLRGDSTAGQKFVVTESLFSMDGDIAPLADYAEICRAYGAALIVDEAHSVGIYGDAGSGLIELSETGDQVFLSINTGGKALGISGAFVAGPAWAIDYLIQHARPFIFSTAPPPAVAEALDASLDVVASEPERRIRLRALACRLRLRLAQAGMDVAPGDSQIIPLVLGENQRALAAADALQREGFDVRPIRPPTVPPGTARLRISVNVHLTEDIQDRFVTALGAALNEVAACSAASS